MPNGAGQKRSDLTPIANAIRDAFEGETLSGTRFGVADSLASIATQLKWLGTGDAATGMGAIEAHGVFVKEAAEQIATAIGSVADAIGDLANAIRESGA